jgi:hypothetical protein
MAVLKIFCVPVVSGADVVFLTYSFRFFGFFVVRGIFTVLGGHAAFGHWLYWFSCRVGG